MRGATPLDSVFLCPRSERDDHRRRARSRASRAELRGPDHRVVEYFEGFVETSLT